MFDRKCACGFVDVCLHAFVCSCLHETEKGGERKAKYDFFTQDEMMQKAVVIQKCYHRTKQAIPSPGNSDQSGFK